MSQIAEMLQRKRKELMESAAAIAVDLHDVEIALAAIGGVVSSESHLAGRGDQAQLPRIAHPMKVGDAIVQAVNAGHSSPKAILEYLQTELGVFTTLNSVRSRVSPLKTEGRIAHDGNGWVPVSRQLDLTNGDNSSPQGETGGAQPPELVNYR